MNITEQREKAALTLALQGRLDTATAPELEAKLATALEGVDTLTLDLGELLYLSSAGLRVILAAQKRMNKQGKMIVKNVRTAIMEVFEITGFVDILDIR